MVPAYILAGGRSRRFGSDKARADVGGRAMIVRVADAAPAPVPVWAVADVAGKYDDLGVATLADAEPGRGPLGGLAAALAHAAEAGHRRVLVLACDQPGVGPLLPPLLEHDAEVVAYRSDGHPRPLPGLYATALLPEVAALLIAGGDRPPGPRRVIQTCHGRGTAVLLPLVTPPADVNRPGDVPDGLRT